MRPALRIAIPTLIAGVTLIACASTAAPSATAAPKAAVAIKGFAFSPATLEVAKGTVVTFTNNDSTTHTITSGANRTKDGKFDRQLSGSAEDSITFDTAGTFEYFCSIHSSMNAKIVVK
jgi:plastocyanin